MLEENINFKELAENAKKYYYKETEASSFTNGEFRPGSRFMSWEHCYIMFGIALNKISYCTDNESKINQPSVNQLALYLSNYLASFGMLRHSFLLEYDYTVHIPIVETILKIEENNN